MHKKIMYANRKCIKIHGRRMSQYLIIFITMMLLHLFVAHLTILRSICLPNECMQGHKFVRKWHADYGMTISRDKYWLISAHFFTNHILISRNLQLMTNLAFKFYNQLPELKSPTRFVANYLIVYNLRILRQGGT